MQNVLRSGGSKIFEGGRERRQFISSHPHLMQMHTAMYISICLLNGKIRLFEKKNEPIGVAIPTVPLIESANGVTECC